MLQPDVLAIRQFYSSPLGQETRNILLRSLARFWPPAGGDVIVGIGYVLPLLRPFLEEAGLIASLMPRSIGAIYWPADTANHSLLVDEMQLPLRDQSINRIIVMHTLENVPHLNTFLKEIWRVLVPGGRALLIAPNRRGVWMRAAQTPFGSGVPFTIAQLRHRAALANLTFVGAETILFFPPSGARLILKMAKPLEWLGRIFLPGCGGMIVCEVEKQIYASIPEAAAVSERGMRYAAEPVVSMRA